MEKKLPLYLAGSAVGAVSCSFDGLHASFRAVCTKNIADIARVYVRAGGAPLLIGVLAPGENGIFTVSKTVTKTTLSSLEINFDAISLAYITTSGKSNRINAERTSWTHPGQNINIGQHDGIITALLSFSETLVDNAEAPTRLAVPLMSKYPFPRPDVLCLLTPEEIDGTLYGIIKISKNGAPRRI